VDGCHIEADVDCDDESALHALLDDGVEIIGAAAGKFDNKMQQTGVVLYVSASFGVALYPEDGTTKDNRL
jgi:hypothetical protein